MSATAASVQASAMLYPKKWVRVEAYCALTGETKKAVFRRREKGQWRDGKHTKIANGRLWVNLIEADLWVESKSQ